MINNNGAMKFVTKSQLEHWYFSEQMSQWDIARKIGVTQGAVLYWFRKHSIQSRSHDDALLALGKSGRFSGSRNPRWNGGRHVHGGYVWIRMPEHRLATRRGYVREHQLVWEQSNNEQLPKGWHVHHKNGIKDDNRPENLEAMTHQKHRDVLPQLLRRIAALEARVKELENVGHGCSCYAATA